MIGVWGFTSGESSAGPRRFRFTFGKPASLSERITGCLRDDWKGFTFYARRCEGSTEKRPAGSKSRAGRGVLRDGVLGEDSSTFVEEDALEHHLESLRVGGLSKGFLLANLASLDEVVQRLIEALHAVFTSSLDGCSEFL